MTFSLGELFQLNWLRRQVESLPVAGQWHAISRTNLRDELFTHLNGMVEGVLSGHGRKKDPVKAWVDAHGARVHEVSTMLAQMRSHGEMDYATLAVALRALGQLADEKPNEQ